MPDTFASKTAALQDDSADAAIGNITGKYFWCDILCLAFLIDIIYLASNFLLVFSLSCYRSYFQTFHITGSNSVNVFLGLGLPWVIKASYLYGQGTKLEMKGDSLLFSVLVFLACAVITLISLILRRVVSQDVFLKKFRNFYIFFLFVGT